MCQFPVLFDEQHGKRAQTLFKSVRPHLSRIFDQWKGIQFEKVTLTNRKFLRMFVNTFPADDKYSLLNRDNLTKQLKCNYLRNKRLFLNIFLQFRNVD